MQRKPINLFDLVTEISSEEAGGWRQRVRGMTYDILIKEVEGREEEGIEGLWGRRYRKIDSRRYKEWCRMYIV
jgi:hypothetical protein